MKKYILLLLILVSSPFMGGHAQIPDDESWIDIGYYNQSFEYKGYAPDIHGYGVINMVFYLGQTMEIELHVPNPYAFSLQAITGDLLGYYYDDGNYPDGYTIKRLLPAGMYAISFEKGGDPYSDSFTLKGEITSAEVEEGTSPYNMIEIGNISEPCVFSKTKRAEPYMNYVNSQHGEYYLFTYFNLLKPMDVVISYCGSDFALISFSVRDFDNGYTEYSYDYSGEKPCPGAENGYLRIKQLPAGEYYIASSLFPVSSRSTLVTTIEFAEEPAGKYPDNPIDLGTYYMDFEYSERHPNAFDFFELMHGYIYYEFNLYNPMDLVIGCSGSQSPKAKISLYDLSGTLLLTTRDPQEIKNVSAGTYSLVVSEFSTNGDIAISINGIPIPDETESIAPERHLSQDKNYIFTLTPTIASPTVNNLSLTQSLQSVEYFDGLGRSEETVQLSFTPGKNNLVNYQEYDNYGRPSKAWLPVVQIGSERTFLKLDQVKNLSSLYYNNDNHPYSLPIYEDSPLNRVIKEYGPGEEWQTANKAVQKDYLTNNQTTYCCKRFKVEDVYRGMKLIPQNNYSNGALHVIKLVDEDGKISYEFKNKRDLVLLTRQMNGNTPYDTYYIYDEFDNLRIVLPPMAVDRLTGSGPWTSAMHFMNEYAYLYKYDHRNRCIAKKLPGADWSYFVYDKTDRLIFSQDSEQRKKGQWIFSIPDAFGRTLLTGLCSNAGGEKIEPGCMDHELITASFHSDGPLYGYHLTISNSPLILTNVSMHSINYYDRYDFLQRSECAGIGLDYVAPEAGYGFCNDYVKAEHTMLTGNIVFNSHTGSILSCSSFYYDYQGRLVQSHSINHLNGTESEYTGYNFTGLPLRKKSVHTALGKSVQTEYYTYEYDHAGRLKETWHQINSGTRYLLAKNEYDELGRPKNKVNHSATHSASKQEYDYNIRSWTTKMKSLPYTQELYYNQSVNGSIPHFNGNIGAIRWKY